MQIVFGVALLHFGAGYHCLFIINGVLFNRSACEWKINEMSHALWSFHFLYESLTLILRVNPCETDGKGKVIMDIQLISRAAGE